jgi:hypothetical protein
MATAELYIVLSIIVLLAIAALIFFVNKGKQKKKMSKLAAVAFAFVIAGIVFAGDQLISYSLIGVGIILAVIDIIIKLRKK